MVMADSDLRSEPGVRKVRLTIPQDDEVVNRWMAEQGNLSVSVRLAIRAEVARSGYGDVLTRPVVPGGVRDGHESGV